MKLPLLSLVVLATFLTTIPSGCVQESPDSHPEQVLTILTALANDPDRLVRRSAAESLGKIGATGGIPALMALLDDSSPMVREAAARALGRFSELSPDPQGLLVTHLTDPSPAVRHSAALSLASITLEPITVSQMTDVLASSEFDDRTTVALGLLGGSEGLDPRHLISDAAHPLAATRQAAVAVLADHRGDDVRSTLQDRLLHDPSADVRAEAAYRLGFWEDPVVAADLAIAAQEDASVQVRRWARQGLRGGGMTAGPD